MMMLDARSVAMMVAMFHSSPETRRELNRWTTSRGHPFTTKNEKAKMFLVLPIMMAFMLRSHGADLNRKFSRIKVATIIESSIPRVRSLEVIESLCRRQANSSSSELFFETHYLPSHHPAFMDGRVESLLGNNVEFIVWIVTCETLDFLPRKLRRKVSFPNIFIGVEPCTAAKPVNNTAWNLVAIADVIQKLKWSDVNIIFDNSIGNADLLSLTEELSARFVKSILFRIDTSSADYKEKVFDKFISLNPNSFARNHFLVILKKENLKEVIHSASILMMTMGKIYWLFVNDNLQPEELIKYGVNPRNANMLLFRSVCDEDGKDFRRINELLSDLQKILPNDNKYILTLICMIIKSLKSTKTPNLKSLAKCRNDPFESMSNIVGILRTPQSPLSNSCYPAFEVATIHEGFDDSVASTIARWRPDTNLIVRHAFFPNRKYGLGNTTIKVTTVPLSPYIMRLTPEKNSGFQGFAVKILEELSHQMNFSFVWQEPEDNEFGMLINGTFTGIVGQLEKREADVAVTALTVSYSRSKVVDYTYPYTEEGRAMLIKKPIDSSTLDMFKVFRAFSLTTWLSFAIVVVVVSLVLTIIDGFKRMSSSHNTIRGLPDNRTAKNLCLFSNLSWKETLWSIYTMHLFQGGAQEPTSARSRVIVMCWWLFTILVSTYYTANLTAHFTIVDQPSTITSLSDLANDQTVVPITLKGSAIYYELKMSNNPVKQAIFKRLEVAPNVKMAVESLPMVKSGKYVFISLWSEVKMLAAQNCEDLMVAGKPYGIRRIALALPKGSALKAEMSTLVGIMREAGLIDKWRHFWWREKAACSDSNDQTPVTLDMESLGGVFIVFALFTLVASLLLVIEIFNHKQNKRKRISLNDVTQY